MAWRLRRDYTLRHPKTGAMIANISYHEGFVIGCPLGSSRPDKAKMFPTKHAAQTYARHKLPGRGYKPERTA